MTRLANLDAIPFLLTQYPRWLLWTLDGTGRKVPRAAAKPTRNIDSTKSSNWTSYDAATKAMAAHESMGLGFALGPVQDGPCFAGVDLDKCRNSQTGVIEEWAQQVIRDLDSYTEISPSGTGVKIFIIGALPESARQGKVYKMEIYDRGRYFTVTGAHLPGTPTTVEYREAKLRELHARAWSKDIVTLTKLFGFYISDGMGWINIHCPWKEQHSGGNQVRDAGLKLGADGKISGFNCFHAGCSERNIGDIRKLFGLKGGDSSDFITDHNGKILPNQENIRRALAMMGTKLEFDVFQDNVNITVGEECQLLDDHLVRRLWLLLDDQYKFLPSREFFYDVVMDTAHANIVHPVRSYLDALQWDGTKRLDTWLMDYCGAEDTEFNRHVGAITLMAAVRRIRKPGCKFDEMLVLEGEQGGFKSTAVAALCPHEDWFSDDLPLHVSSREIIERTRGKWIVEASDLAGMRKGEVEHLKSMLSRYVDGPVRMAYGRTPVHVPRSFIIIGTTNASAYLKDTSGNRRFWPVRTSSINIPELRRHRDQLWAEAASREALGESIRLDPKLYPDAEEVQETRRVQDTWEELLRDSEIDLQATHILSESIWALLQVNHHDPRNAERLYAVMQRLGYPKKHRCNYNGRNAMHWIRKDVAIEWGLYVGPPAHIKLKS